VVPWFTWPAATFAIAGVGLLTNGDASQPFVPGRAVQVEPM